MLHISYTLLFHCGWMFFCKKQEKWALLCRSLVKNFIYNLGYFCDSISGMPDYLANLACTLLCRKGLETKNPILSKSNFWTNLNDTNKPLGIKNLDENYRNFHSCTQKWEANLTDATTGFEKKKNYALLKIEACEIICIRIMKIKK